jgi:hypothetical protein
MHWQDLVFTVGQWIFIPALFPMFTDPPPLKTSIPTALVLSAYGISFMSLGFYTPATSVFICSSIWMVLVRLKIKEGKPEKDPKPECYRGKKMTPQEIAEADCYHCPHQSTCWSPFPF